jgi:hypothetical protein
LSKHSPFLMFGVRLPRRPVATRWIRFVTLSLPGRLPAALWTGPRYGSLLHLDTFSSDHLPGRRIPALILLGCLPRSILRSWLSASTSFVCRRTLAGSSTLPAGGFSIEISFSFSPSYLNTVAIPFSLLNAYLDISRTVANLFSTLHTPHVDALLPVCCIRCTQSHPTPDTSVVSLYFKDTQVRRAVREFDVKWE